MFGMLTAVLFAHLVIAAVEIPPLWGRQEQRGERWAVIGLLLLSTGLALLLVTQSHPPSLWELIDAVFRPVGTPLFKPQRG